MTHYIVTSDGGLYTLPANRYEAFHAQAMTDHQAYATFYDKDAAEAYAETVRRAHEDEQYYSDYGDE